MQLTCRRDPSKTIWPVCYSKTINTSSVMPSGETFVAPANGFLNVKEMFKTQLHTTSALSAPNLGTTTLRMQSHGSKSGQSYFVKMTDSSSAWTACLTPLDCGTLTMTLKVSLSNTSAMVSSIRIVCYNKPGIPTNTGT
jgi:hypothetical protein